MGSITSRDDLSYTFVPYRYDPYEQRWILLRDHIAYDATFYQIDEKPSELYRILVLSDGELARRLYIYRPSKTRTEAIVESRIHSEKNALEKTAELTEEVDEKYKLAAAILNFDPVRPVMHRPEIEITEVNNEEFFTVTVADYDMVALSPKEIFLAALEVTELYAEEQYPHRIRITDEILTVNRRQFLVNSDTEYVFYFIDENGVKLSQVTLVSFDDLCPVDDYEETYRRIQYNRYIRKLYSVFQQYDPVQWDEVSLASERYFSNATGSMSFADFLIHQIAGFDPGRLRIDFLMQLVLLNELKDFMDIDQDFVRQQVHSRIFRTHILPVLDAPYLARITTVNGNVLECRHELVQDEVDEIRMDKDEFIFIQCIDPVTWKSSSIAFYNNRVGGRPYFYFPKLEVEVI